MCDKPPEAASTESHNGMDYFALWNLKPDEDHLVFATEGYVIWLDKAMELDWQTTKELDIIIAEKISATELNAVLNKAALLQSYPIDHLGLSKQKNFRIMVGEGLARAFELDVKNATVMLEKAAEFARARNQEIARIWYLLAAGFGTAFFVLAFELGWYAREVLREQIGETAFVLGLSSCAGAFGSFFSILTRVGNTPLDPSAGWQLHWLEGFGRILIGVIGAFLAIIAVKVGLCLTILADKGYTGLLLVAVIAGASERFVPSLIKKIELDITRKEGVEK